MGPQGPKGDTGDTGPAGSIANLEPYITINSTANTIVLGSTNNVDSISIGSVSDTVALSGLGGSVSVAGASVSTAGITADSQVTFQPSTTTYSITSSYDPKTLGNCIVHLDASNYGGVQSTGVGVSQWNNLATTTSAMPSPLQGQLSNMPTYNATAGPNGKPCIEFNGTQWLQTNNQTWTADFSTGITMFAVFNMQLANTYEVIMSLGNMNTAPAAGSSFNGIELYREGTDQRLNFDFNRTSASQFTALTNASALTINDTWKLMVFAINTAGQVYMGDNATSLATKFTLTGATNRIPPSTNRNYCYIGNNSTNNYKLYGQIAEIIMFNTALSDADRTNVVYYLQQKYTWSSIPITQPSTIDPATYGMPSYLHIDRVLKSTIVRQGGNMTNFSTPGTTGYILVNCWSQFGCFSSVVPQNYLSGGINAYVSFPAPFTNTPWLSVVCSNPSSSSGTLSQRSVAVTESGFTLTYVTTDTSTPTYVFQWIAIGY